jgi:PIN domain nuclease of toxin-antitoxin system
LPLLLDTHAFLWWLDGDPNLSTRSKAAISANPADVHVSSVSAWEISTKARLGKLPDALDVAADVAGCIAREGFRPLAVSVEHGQRAGALPGPIKDPFDRMLIAQAILDGLHLVSIEQTFDAYGVLRLW